MNATFNKIIIGLALVLLIVGGVFGYQKLYATGETTPAPDGAIEIPADLKAEWEPAVKRFDEIAKQIEELQKQAQAIQPQLEQIFRVTLDRAKVKPTEFQNYGIDPTDKNRLIKKPAQAPAPAR